MTKRGFYSVVAHRDDHSRVLVRARCERDLVALSDLLPEATVKYTPDADYHWRVECTADQWTEAVAQMSREIDYPNFKAAITDKAHHRAYLDVWHDLLALTDSKPEQEDRIMLDLAADPNAHYEPGDPDVETITFITPADEASRDGD